MLFFQFVEQSERRFFDNYISLLFADGGRIMNFVKSYEEIGSVKVMNKSSVMGGLNMIIKIFTMLFYDHLYISYGRVLAGYRNLAFCWLAPAQQTKSENTKI